MTVHQGKVRKRSLRSVAFTASQSSGPTAKIRRQFLQGADVADARRRTRIVAAGHVIEEEHGIVSRRVKPAADERALRAVDPLLVPSPRNARLREERGEVVLVRYMVRSRVGVVANPMDHAQRYGRRTDHARHNPGGSRPRQAEDDAILRPGDGLELAPRVFLLPLPREDRSSISGGRSISGRTGRITWRRKSAPRISASR